MPYTRGKKRLPAAAIVGVKVNTNFVSQAYLAALACADKAEGKRPTLPLKDWTKLVADKNGWQETMIATVCSEWFARLWVARSTDNLHLIFKATEETVKDYERVLENRPRTAGLLLTETGCLAKLRELAQAESDKDTLTDPVDKLVMAGLGTEEAVRILRVLSIHGQIKEDLPQFKRIRLTGKQNNP